MRVLLTGGAGMLGRALQRLAAGRPELEIVAPGRRDYDLTDQAAVARMLADARCEAVIHAAAKVGGIQANIAEPYAFLTDNLLINAHVIDEAYRAGVRRLMFVGSSCMYPKDYRNPLREEDVLAAPLEPTNEGYAISKIAGAKACEYLSSEQGVAYRTVIPCNLYGPGDTFDPARSHLISAVIAKTAQAIHDRVEEIEIWGDGEARREFLFIDDLASFMLDLLPRLEEAPSLLNIGALGDHSVNEYYRVVADVLGFRGRFVHDLSKPVGMKHKLVDSSRAAALGYRPAVSLQEGIAIAAQHYLESRP